MRRVVLSIWLMLAFALPSLALCALGSPAQAYLGASSSSSRTYLPLVMRTERTPTPPPACNTSLQAIVNPEFDAPSIEPWGTLGFTERTGIGYLTPPYSMYLGGYDNAEDGLYQDVVVPAWAEYAEVLFAAYMFSEDSTVDGYDALATAVYSGETRVSPILALWNNGTRGEWLQGSIPFYDVRSLRGQTLTLLYGAFTNSTLRTGWLVDHVWFMFGCGAAGQATAQGYEAPSAGARVQSVAPSTTDPDRLERLLDDLVANRRAASPVAASSASQIEREQLLRQSVGE